jgi:hypothetical protein
VNRLLKSIVSQLTAKTQVSAFSADAYVRYIEAAKTFEERVLLQVIDEDARAVAHDPEMGWTVFGELVNRNKEILLNTIAARREIGFLLKRFSISESDRKDLAHGSP